MKKWLLLSTLLVPVAQAQSPLQMQMHGHAVGGTPAPTAADIAQSGVAKPDAQNGVLTNATINGGVLNDPSGTATIRLGNAGTNPTWYPLTGTRQYGGAVVQNSPWGFGNQSGSLGIYTNQSQQQIDYGCATGGFGENIENRGYATSSDMVSVCHLVNSTIPLATLNYGTDFTLANDPGVAVPQYQTYFDGDIHHTTGLGSQQTQINFFVPLGQSILSALRPNMFIRTSTGWTGFIASWDPAGHWIKVDTWVALVNAGVANGTTAFVGYSPLAQWTSPTGVQGTSMTIYINAVSGNYGYNGISNHVAGSYCLFGFGCSMEHMEFGVANDVLPFVRTNEYDWFQDEPRDIGALIGSGGTYATSAAIAIAGGKIDKGIVVGEGQYAGVLVEPFGDYPMGVGFMSHQITGVSFAVKNPAVQDYTFQVDARTGSIRQGGQGTTVSTVRGTVSLQSASNASVQYLTTDGASRATNGGNEMMYVPPGSQVSITAQLQVSDGAAGVSQLYSISCLYERTVGGTVSAAPYQSAAPIVASFQSTPNQNYAVACGTDTANNYAEIIVGKTTNSQANWTAAYTAVVGPL